MADKAKTTGDTLVASELSGDVGKGPGCLGRTITVAVMVLLVIAVVGSLFCLQKVEAWEVGLRYWNVSAPPFIDKEKDVGILRPGYNIIVPYLHRFHKFDCRLQRFDMAPTYPDLPPPDQGPLKVRTMKDQDEIDVYVTIFYHVNRNHAATLRADYKTNQGVRDTVIRGTCMVMVKDYLEKIMTSNQFYSMTKKKREWIQARKKTLESVFKDPMVLEYETLANQRAALEKSLALRTESLNRLEAENKNRELRLQKLELEPDSPEKERRLAELKSAIQRSEDQRQGLLPLIEQSRGELAELTARTSELASRLEDKYQLKAPDLLLLEQELARLNERYPDERYLLDRTTQVQAALAKMNEMFNPHGVTVTAVIIWDFKFKDEIEASIISKVIADERVELERALKAAAGARADWQKKVAEANAAAEVELARGRAEARKLDAEGQSYRLEQEAKGDFEIMKAKSVGLGMINAFLQGRGAEVYVGLEYAKALEGVELLVLPSGGEGALNPLDLQKTILQGRPARAR